MSSSSPSPRLMISIGLRLLPTCSGSFSSGDRAMRFPRKRAEKLTKLKKQLPKATKSEQVEMARKIRDMTPGAEVVITNWGLGAVDR